MISVQNLRKEYNGKEVLKGVSFEIKEGEFFGLLGPNGAGKTTLMRIIVGYLKQTSGSILSEGKRVNTDSIRHKRRIGYLPENNPLYLYMSVKEYLKFIADIKEVDNTAIEKVIKECGLKNVLGQKIETLSKGYKQRVGLAGAILGNPKLLILDEPTSGLDPNQIIEIRQLIKRLATKKLIILSTHILPEAREICERLLIISNGKIVMDDKTKSILNLEKKFVELTS